MPEQKRIITHNGQFHTDDVCAVATLMLVFGKDQVTIHRTRDKQEIVKGDIVVDVGGIYDEEALRFDHHQCDGSGARENGIPYASFGLVWKAFGVQICGTEAVAKRLDEKLVQPVDAVDNGVSISSPVIDGIYQFTIVDFFQSYQGLGKINDEAFLEAVDAACDLISREILRIKNNLLLEQELESIYYESEDKEIIIASKYYPWKALIDKPEPKFFVYPDEANGNWMAKAVPERHNSFSIRKPFPLSWAGKCDEDLEQESGVMGAVFCHNKRFIVAAKSRDAALELAHKALLT